MMKTGISATVVEAFEINDTANDVYEHNFGHRPYQVGCGVLVIVSDLDVVDLFLGLKLKFLFFRYLFQIHLALLHCDTPFFTLWS